MMLIFGFFFLFVACIVYMHTDISISKSSASYLAKLQWDEVGNFDLIALSYRSFSLWYILKWLLKLLCILIDGHNLATASCLLLLMYIVFKHYLFVGYNLVATYMN